MTSARRCNHLYLHSFTISVASQKSSPPSNSQNRSRDLIFGQSCCAHGWKGLHKFPVRSCGCEISILNQILLVDVSVAFLGRVFFFFLNFSFLRWYSNVLHHCDVLSDEMQCLHTHTFLYCIFLTYHRLSHTYNVFSSIDRIKNLHDFLKHDIKNATGMNFSSVKSLQ